MIGKETCPFPEDPWLAEAAVALNDGGFWAEIADREWRGVYMTDDARRIYGHGPQRAPYPIGVHIWGPERVETSLSWSGGQFPMEVNRQLFALFGPFILADTPGGREELRDLVHPGLQDLVDGMLPIQTHAMRSVRSTGIYTGGGAGVEILTAVVRVRDDEGNVAGTALISKPAPGMATLARITAMGDRHHFDRLELVAKPARRPAAVMFVDLESSSPLARRLSTASYFTLVRRMARAADQAVVDAGGLVGSHAGDGIVAFFLAETCGSESAAAQACISASRSLRHAIAEVAERCGLKPQDVVLRFGLHWGSNLYVGQIATSGRTEVTALGDQVNETARIEACASGGRALASKDLIERLVHGDATRLDLDPERVTYTPLADLSTATEKARRDAPAIAVCEV